MLCEKCGKEFENDWRKDKELIKKNLVPRFCCNGDMCGCMGLPIYPPICSEECLIKAGYTPVKREGL